MGVHRGFGPTHYSFDLGSVHYVVINNVFYHGAGYLGYVDATQLAWLAADLASVERGAPVVVFLHIPALSTIDQRSTNATRPGSGNSTMNREALYRLLELRIPAQSGQAFRLNPARYSGRIRPPILGESGHPFWRHPARRPAVLVR